MDEDAASIDVPICPVVILEREDQQKLTPIFPGGDTNRSELELAIGPQRRS